MSTKQPTDSSSTEHEGKSGRTLEELYDHADDLIRQMDRLVHDELGHKPEAVAEWEEIMRDYEAALAEDQREAEEAKLDREIHEWMDRINADIDQLEKLDPVDLEFDEALARMLASWREVDAVMRLRCRHYPEKLVKWEEEVMGPVKRWEGLFAADMEAEEAKPGN